MATVDDLRKQILTLEPEQAVELASWLDTIIPQNREVAPGIEIDPRICGGEPRIVKTRIPVWTLEQSRRLGMSDAELLEDYPSLKAEDLVRAWDYVASHREEIERQILENESA